jgi:hypothetical protein
MAGFCCEGNFRPPQADMSPDCFPFAITGDIERLKPLSGLFSVAKGRFELPTFGL